MTQRIDIEFVPDTWRKTLDLYLAEHAHGMNGYMLSRGHLERIMRLHAMTEPELALLGLKHDEIVPHVLGDLLAA
ncbi:DUF1127 domain-containing protein [Roseovarius sp. MMSF_3281]|uniref:DUF1127 domain-containing protein n=1 Tax=Roseovarius sp. MMSF_3281 TaxID=3046694 RepID=UPI00273D0FAF|nr:DUF1127 domain-containing protein [Roseovarius sp. MMSF_3281]